MSLLKIIKNLKIYLGESGLIKQLQKAIFERILEAEMTTELGYKKHDPVGNNSGNSRNGYSQKNLKTTQGDILIDIPRGRNGEFSLKIVKNIKLDYIKLRRNNNLFLIDFFRNS